jgi:hypothetical protein
MTIVSTTLQELHDKTGHGITGGGSVVPISSVMRTGRGRFITWRCSTG